jgi:hypothetical protein
MKFKNPLKKFNSIRKKNWSTPAIISVLILIMMILVYSFESLGLLNKERNLDMRLSNPENIIKNSYRDLKIIHYEKFKEHTKKDKKGDNDYYLLNSNINVNLLNKIDKQSKKRKEQHLLNIQKILLDGAFTQIIYEIEKRNKEKDKYFFIEEQKQKYKQKNQNKNNYNYYNHLNNYTNYNNNYNSHLIINPDFIPLAYSSYNLNSNNKINLNKNNRNNYNEKIDKCNFVYFE